MSKRRLFASVMAADYTCFAEDVRAAVAAGVDGLHFDIMDGVFVPNITFGRDLVAAMRPLTDLPFNAHLMVAKPDLIAEQMIEAGANQVAIHPEAGGQLPRSLARIRELGAQPGLAVSPGIPLEMIEWLLEHVDYLVLMSVNPGFSGQAFIPSSKQKLQETAEMISQRGRDMRILLDGGVSPDNVAELAQLGATDFVAGGAIFYNRPDADRAKVAAERVRQLREAMS